MKERLISRDVKTRWNSTYNMLNIAVLYRPVLDAVTLDKKLKLRGYELDEQDWVALGDLLRVLEVTFFTRC